MNLVKKAQSSIIWNTLFNIFKDIVNFCVMLILVRLLSPDDYGQFTLVTNIIGVIAAFSRIRKHLSDRIQELQMTKNSFRVRRELDCFLQKVQA